MAPATDGGSEWPLILLWQGEGVNASETNLHCEHVSQMEELKRFGVGGSYLKTHST